MTATPYSLYFKSHLSPLLEAHIQSVLFLMPWESTQERQRESESGRVWWRSGVGIGRCRERRERTSLRHVTEVVQILGVVINLSLKIVMRSFPPFRSHFIFFNWQDIFVGYHLCPPSPSCHPLLSSFLLMCPFPLRHCPKCKMVFHTVRIIIVISSVIWMTAIHLFILELFITVKSITYPARQASHSHSRYYLITVTAAMGLQEQCCNQVWCMQWLGSSSEKKPGWLSRLSLNYCLCWQGKALIQQFICIENFFTIFVTLWRREL